MLKNKNRSRTRFSFLEKLENLLCFLSILFIFIFNYNEEGGKSVTNALIIMFSGLEFTLMMFRNQGKMPFGAKCYGLFALWCLFSAMYSDVPDDSLIKVKTVGIMFFFMVALCNYQFYKSRSNLLLKFVIYSSVAAALYLLNQSGWIDGKRANCIVGDSNQAGLYFAVSGAVLLFSIKTKRINRIIGWGGLVVIIWAIMISGSRSSLAELFVGIILTQIFMDSANDASMMKRLFGFLIIAIGLIWVYNFIMTDETMHQILGRRIESFFEIKSGQKSSMNENSTFERQLLSQYAWTRFKERPITGYGLDSFSSYIEPILGKHMFAHNNYLDLLCNVGIIGTALYYAFHINSLKNCIKKRNAESYLAIVIIIQMLIGHIAVVFYYLKLEVIFWVLIMGLIPVSDTKKKWKFNTQWMSDKKNGVK